MPFATIVHSSADVGRGRVFVVNYFALIVSVGDKVDFLQKLRVWAIFLMYEF
jgi:hypothetical protein